MNSSGSMMQDSRRTSSDIAVWSSFRETLLAIAGRRPRWTGYTAFISYSHALDGKLAPALQTRVERFAKPWYTPRSIRVFRDEANLAASPALWASIEEALQAARWFILLASPESACSVWVEREIAWWLEHRSPSTLLIVLTSGQIIWGTKDFDWTSTTALPRALLGAFPQEPRWVDLSDLGHKGEIDSANPSFQAAVADVAATVRELPKDALVGEHVRLNRRALRLARAAITVLLVLLLTAASLAFLAVAQLNIARTQASIATSNYVLASADKLQQTNPSLAADLYASAYRTYPTLDSAVAVMSTQETPLSRVIPGSGGIPRSGVLFDTPLHLIIQFGVKLRISRIEDPGVDLLAGAGPEARTAALSPDSKMLAVGNLSTQLLNIADPKKPIPIGRPLPNLYGNSVSISFTPDGHTLVVGSDDKSISLWDVRNPTTPVPIASPLRASASVASVAVSPNGQILASGSLDEKISLWDLSNPQQPRQFTEPFASHNGNVGALAFSPDSHILATGSDRTVQLWYVADPASPAALATLAGHTGEVFAVAFSPDGRMLASGGGGDFAVRLWDVHIPNFAGPLGSPLVGHTDTVGGLAFSPDGRTLATSSSDSTARLWDLSPSRRKIRQDSNSQSLSFSPNDRVLGIRTMKNLELADVATVTGANGPTSPVAIGAVSAGSIDDGKFSFDSDGHTLAALFGGDVRLFDYSDLQHPRLLKTFGIDGGLTDLAFIPRTPNLAAVTSTGELLIIDTSETEALKVVGSMKLGSGVNIDNATGDGRYLVINKFNGNVETLSFVSLSTLSHPVEVGLSIPSQLGRSTISSDSSMLATVRDAPMMDGSLPASYVDVWDVRDPAKARRISSTQIGSTVGRTYGVVFGSNGHNLFVSTTNGVRVVDLTDPTSPLVVGRPILSSNSSLIASDHGGMMIAVPENDQGVVVWATVPAMASAAICSATGGISQSDWDQYVPGSAYVAPCS